MSHQAAHPSAGETVTVEIKGHHQLPDGRHEYRLEDWWDRITGGSWMTADGNPAAMIYGMRSGLISLPIDDEVVYGKIGSLGHLVHVSEIVR